MNKTMESPSTHEEMATPAKKAPYLSPSLRCYGSVSTLTGGSGGSNPDMNNFSKLPSGMMEMSDRRTKEHLIRVGDHPLGIGIYLFDFKTVYRDQWGHGRQFGVMADEVERVMPEAVSMHPDGYKMVNYAMLGISRSLH
jgi:hypothetical protein